MKIFAGQYYRTRGGQKAFVNCICLPDPFTGKAMAYPVIGFIDGFGTARWDVEGAFSHQPWRDDHRDIVSEWREPEKVVRWVNLYRDDGMLWTGHPCGSLEGAKSEGQVRRNSKLIARKRVEITENEFDE